MCKKSSKLTINSTATLERPLQNKVLSGAGRKHIKPSYFAIPSEQRYPIHDAEHAKNALARVSQFGTDEEKSKVRAAVARKYPGMSVSGKTKNQDMGEEEDEGGEGGGGDSSDMETNSSGSSGSSGLTINRKRMQVITANMDGPNVRHEILEGRNYLVVPTVMLTHGVHAGSNGPLYYPETELSKTPVVWDHKPIVINHPMENGQAASACKPTMISARKVGVILNTTYVGGRGGSPGKLKCESWLEINQLKAKAPQIFKALEKKQKVEVSTGLFTDNESEDGVWNKKQYTAVARNYRPDHLAILPDERGACSIKDGAGLMQNASTQNGNLPPQFAKKKKGMPPTPPMPPKGGKGTPPPQQGADANADGTADEGGLADKIQQVIDAHKNGGETDQDPTAQNDPTTDPSQATADNPDPDGDGDDDTDPNLDTDQDGAGAADPNADPNSADPSQQDPNAQDGEQDMDDASQANPNADPEADPNQDPDETTDPNAPPNAKPPGAKQTKPQGGDASHGMIHQQLQQLLRQNDPDCQLTDCFPKFCVYACKGQLFQQPYVQKGGSVALAGKPVPVVKKIQYATTDGKVLNTSKRIVNNSKAGVPMNKKQLVSRLIRNAATKFAEEDREMLMALDESMLRKMSPVANFDKQASGIDGIDSKGDDGGEELEDAEDQVKPKKPKAASKGTDNKYGDTDDTLNKTTPQQTSDEEDEDEDDMDDEGSEPNGKGVRNSAQSLDEYLHQMPAPMREMVVNGLQLQNSARRKLISTITSNSANRFSVKVLNNKSMEELTMLADLARGSARQTASPIANFAGMGDVSSQYGGFEEADGEEPALGVPTMNFEKSAD